MESSNDPLRGMADAHLFKASHGSFIEPISDEAFGFLKKTFIGRKTELVFLREWFASESFRPLLIWGSTGIGKTSLARFFEGELSALNKLPTVNLHSYLPNEYRAQFQRIEADNKLPLDKKCLIVIDDFSPSSDLRELHRFLEYLKISYPKAKLMIVSSWFENPLKTESFENLELKGLSRDESVSMVEARLKLVNNEVKEISAITQGHPLLLTMIQSLLNDAGYTPRDILKYVANIYLPAEFKLENQSRNLRKSALVISDVSDANQKLISMINKDPIILYRLHHRKFEEIIAEVLGGLGYEITLTPRTRDGGVDIFAASKGNLGSFLYIVECKLYTPPNHVGVAVIRDLYGTVQFQNATAGILATTSYFTKNAKVLSSQQPHRISLIDYLGLQRWFDEYVDKNLENDSLSNTSH